MHTLTDIKHLRKKYHLTQKELASRANVSQSLIAKIESGLVDPTYSKSQQIFQALDQLQETTEHKAKEIMQSRVLTVQYADALREVIKIMKSKGISQVPVLQREKICGIVTESTILNRLAEHPEKVSSLKVHEVMEDTPPIVSLSTGFRTLTELLKNHPVVLVAEKGDIKGIISKSDLLGKVE